MRYASRGSLVLLVMAVAVAVHAADLTTADGKKITGDVVAVGPDGVTLRTGMAEATIPGTDILLVDLGHPVAAAKPGTRYHEVELTDGTRLLCASYSVTGKTFEAELLAGPDGVPPPTIAIPLANVFYVCRGADDEAYRAEWKKMLQTRGKRDLYVIRQLAGLNFLQGTILGGSADGKLLTFEKEDGTRDELRQSRATGGLVFSQPPPAEVPATLCKVLDVFGNTLLARAIDLTDTGVKVTTVSGVVANYPTAAGVAKLDYSKGNIAYLSDLVPKVNAPEPPAEEAGLTLGIRAPYIADTAPAGDPLNLGNVTYPKGLWVPAGTILTYTLGGDFREFRAVAGIHDQFGNSTTEVKVTIEADGRVLFADTLRRKDGPKDVTLDVLNVQQLRIRVESDAPFFNGSQAVLADARVTK